VSCRHDLALGTCTRCWPSTGTVEPGPEEGYGENLEGPGAVTAEEWSRGQRSNVQGHTLDERFKSLTSPERGFYWKGIRSGLTPTQAITYAVDENIKVDRSSRCSTMHQLTVPCGHPGCAENVSQWSQCPVQACSLDLGYCRAHGGRTRAENEMRLHVLGHEPQPRPSISSNEPT
jgi:hypothetical protein